MPLVSTFEKFKIWQNATNLNTTCVITCHAGPNGQTFTVPAGMKITFYVKPGEAFKVPFGTQHVMGKATDPSAYKLDRSLSKASVFAGQSCPDYVLSKLQDYHGADWGPANLARKLASAVIQLKPEETMDNIKSLVDNYDLTGSGNVVDIVTVRFRPVKSACRFQDIVAELSRLNYSEVHCAFCR